MDEIDELLTWLLANQLITMNQVRTWEVKAYLYANNEGMKTSTLRDALRAMVRWYQERS